MTDLDDDVNLTDIPDDLPMVETGCVATEPEQQIDIWTARFLSDRPDLAAAAAGEFAPSALSKIYGWVDPHFSTMRRSGIVGDARHLAGYHRSRQRLLNAGKTADYSIQAPADKRGERWACCGIDISFGPREMIIATRRLMNACKPDGDGSYDPRIEPVREFFGTLDGRKVTGWNRYPSSNRRVGYTTSDSSHLWHVHISAFRDYADDEDKMRGVADVLNGVPLKPAPPPLPKPDQEEDDMPLTDADIDKIAERVREAVLEDKVIPTYHRAPEGGWPDGKQPGPWALHSLLRSTRLEIDDIEKKIDALTALINEAIEEPAEPQP